jgi:hypothetical protein
MTTQTPQELRTAAAAADRDAAESFERSDTDGFLSQWASGITARLYRAQAALAEAGGRAAFPALFDTAGNLVPAKLVETRWGMAWGLLPGDDPRGRFTGWFRPSKARSAAVRQANDAARGYQVGRVMAPARAEIMGSGTGLSGAASASVGVRRTDGGFSRVVTVVTAAGYEPD